LEPSESKEVSLPLRIFPFEPPQLNAARHI
jgi:hypothetical protein